MANPFTSPTISGYNATPPPDDGSTGADNTVQWQKHIDKIGDPIKTLSEAIAANVTTAFGKIFGNTYETKSANYTVLDADQGKLLVASNAITFTLPSATSVGSNWVVALKNNSSGVVTIDGDTSELINGATTFTLVSGDSAVLVSNGAAWQTIRGNGSLHAQVSSVYALTQLGSTFTDGSKVLVGGFFSDADGGGGVFVWDASQARSGANGGTIIDPTAIGSWDGTQATLAAQYYGASGQGNGSGNGCWVRVYSGSLFAEMFGALGGGGSVNDTASISAAVSATSPKQTLEFDGSKTYIVTRILQVPTDVKLLGNGCTLEVPIDNWDGSITQFFALFSTVNVTARPLTILWRIGTGTISYKNIVIDGFHFKLNRDGAVLTSGQMSTSEFNIVRFEDARHCVVKNCVFEDEMTTGNYNQSQSIFFVRSDFCKMLNNRFVKCPGLYMPESNRCIAKNNQFETCPGSVVESNAGKGHIVQSNWVDQIWAEVSCFSMNSQFCDVRKNHIELSSLSGFTIGHDEPSGANFYNVAVNADHSVFAENIIEAGDTTSTNQGYDGFLWQNGAHVTIEANHVAGLREKATISDVFGCVKVSGSGAAARFTGIKIYRNNFSGGTWGVVMADGADVDIVGNSIYGGRGGVFFTPTGSNTFINVSHNFFDDMERCVVIQSGNGNVCGNEMTNVTDTAFANVLQRGSYNFDRNYMNEVGKGFASLIDRLSIVGNTIENVTPVSQIFNLDNSSTAGTATIDHIHVAGNRYDGATNVLRITNFLGQSTRLIDFTVPTQQTTTSYNVGTLPTSSSGLSAGDIWNNSNVVNVV